MTSPNLRKSPARFAIPKLTYRVWTVWRRNFDVFTKTIAVNFVPSLLEPILYLLAFGYGLGGFIPSIRGQSYISFIAPALVAISIMNGSFFECTFASFVRMYFQKTFDAIVATPVSVEEVVAGELL
jgi:lipooligosaccharide transport system permease protein